MSIKSWLKYLGAALVFILLAVGAKSGYEAAVKERYFDVTEVRIEGVSSAPESEIKRLIGPVEGKNSLTLDMKEIGESLLTHPWVDNVDMRRELPSALVIIIREKVPAFVGVFGGQAWLMDGKGTLIEKVDRPEHVFIPFLAGVRLNDGARPAAGAAIDKALAELGVMAAGKLGGYKLYGKYPFAGLDFGEPGVIKAVFKDTSALIRFPARKWTDEVERLLTVDHILRSRGGREMSLNLLFANKVIAVHPMGERAVNGGGEGNG
jgi:hypothetical protein